MKKRDTSFNNFIFFWFGSLVAAIGSGMTSFALGVHVFEMTGLASSKTTITLLGFLPNVVLAPFAGVLADKYDRRKLMIAGDGLSGLGVLLILLSMVFNFESYWIIGLGVFISSVFSSIIEPAARATITDLVTQENYTKASGLLQLAGSARFLISPILAAFLMSYSSIKVILLIDILTIFLTVATVNVIKKQLITEKVESDESFNTVMKEGFTSLKSNKPLYQLVLISLLVTFAIGFIQELSTPMILSFASRELLGVGVTFSALGMVASSLFLGAKKMDKDPINILFVSLLIAGVAMIGFGLRENVILMGVSGFIFFATLPFLNAAMDFLVRVNTPNESQGRIWGIITIISQIGYIISYILIGPLADFVFRPMLAKNGLLARSIGYVIGVGPGRGMGLMIILAGLGMIIVTLLANKYSDIRK